MNGQNPASQTPVTTSRGDGASAPEGDRVSARRLQTRGRLIDAARTVMAAKGVHGASVEEICEVAGFTRGAFYSNYVDKEALVLDLVGRERSRLLDAVDLDLVSQGLEAAIESVLAAHAPQTDLFVIQTELTLHAVRSPEARAAVLGSEKAFRDALVSVLSAGFERLRRAPVIPLADLAELVIGVSERSFRTAALAGDADSLRLARTTLPHILRAFTEPIEGAREAL